MTNLNCLSSNVSLLSHSITFPLTVDATILQTAPMTVVDCKVLGDNLDDNLCASGHAFGAKFCSVRLRAYVAEAKHSMVLRHNDEHCTCYTGGFRGTPRLATSRRKLRTNWSCVLEHGSVCTMQHVSKITTTVICSISVRSF